MARTHIWPWEELIQHHVRKAQPLHSPAWQYSTTIICEKAQHSHLTLTRQKGTTLTSDLDSSERHNTHIHKHGSTQLLSFVERHSTYIWPWLIIKALSPRLRVPGNWPGASIQRMAIALISDYVGTNPIVTSEWPALISDMEGTNPLTMIEWQ